MQSDGGVSWYTHATAENDVYFPEGHVACQYCQLFCRYEENFRRYGCRLTGEWLLDPFHNIGLMCPLKFKED